MSKKTDHSPMTNAAWKQCIVGLLDGVERELHADASAEDKDALKAMGSLLERKRITEARKPFERKIDRFIESRPYLFAASHRHVGKVLPSIVEHAASTMKRAKDLLDRASNLSPEQSAVAACRSASLLMSLIGGCR
jgi:hypothetical protein